MLTKPHSPIAREGWVPLTALFAVGVILWHWLGALASLPLWVLFGTALYLFRDPPRRVPALPLAVVSPIHGTVVEVCDTYDPWLDRPAIRARLRMAAKEIYSVRSPIEGKIVRHLVGPNREGDDNPRAYVFWIQTDEGDDIILDLRLKRFPARLRCYAHPGERVGQGQRCGYLFFGGTVDLYMPANSRVDLQAGQRVQGGSEIIAHLIHKEPVSVATPLQAA